MVGNMLIQIKQLKTNYNSKKKQKIVKLPSQGKAQILINQYKILTDKLTQIKKDLEQDHVPQERVEHALNKGHRVKLDQEKAHILKL